jgi:hypothetical protein
MLKPDRDFVPCQMNYQTLATFRDWMGMGKQPGMMSWRMTGTKCGFDDLPRIWWNVSPATMRNFSGKLLSV